MLWILHTSLSFPNKLPLWFHTGGLLVLNFSPLPCFMQALNSVQTIMHFPYCTVWRVTTTYLKCTTMKDGYRLSVWMGRWECVGIHLFIVKQKSLKLGKTSGTAGRIFSELEKQPTTKPKQHSPILIPPISFLAVVLIQYYTDIIKYNTCKRACGAISTTTAFSGICFRPSWNSTGFTRLFTWYSAEEFLARSLCHWDSGIDVLIHRAERGLGCGMTCRQTRKRDRRKSYRSQVNSKTGKSEQPLLPSCGTFSYLDCWRHPSAQGDKTSDLRSHRCSVRIFLNLLRKGTHLTQHNQPWNAGTPA